MTESIRKKRILVDTDPNMWVPRRDIDDALALLFLIASPEVEIQGITVNFGNVSAPVGYATARELLDRTGSSIPLYRGASSQRDLGKKNEAVEFLIQTVKDAPGEITLLALAPLTNVATAALLDDTFLRGLGGLVIMGGTFRFPVFSFFGEFNFHLDGSAAATVLSAPVSKSMIPMELCSQAVFTERHLAMLKQSGTEMVRYIVRFIEPWLAINKRIFFRKKGFFPWDVVAAATLIDDSLFDSAPRTFLVRESGLRRGSLTSLSSSPGAGPAEQVCKADVPERLCADRFMDLFLSRLLHHTEQPVEKVAVGGCSKSCEARILHETSSLAVEGFVQYAGGMQGRQDLSPRRPGSSSTMRRTSCTLNDEACPRESGGMKPNAADGTSS